MSYPIIGQKAPDIELEKRVAELEKKITVLEMVMDRFKDILLTIIPDEAPAE